MRRVYATVLLLSAVMTQCLGADVLPLGAALRPDPRVEILEKQLETIRGFQSDLLQTVYWSLGIVVVIAVTLVGYNWFTTNKLYQRERRAMIRQMRSASNARVAAATQTLRAQMLEEHERVDATITSVRSEIASRLEESAKRQAESTSKIVDKRAARIEMLLTKARRESAEYADDWSIAVTRSLQQIKEAIGTDMEYFVEDGLESLIRAMDNKGSLSEGELERLPDLMKMVPKNLAKLVNTVFAKVAEAKGPRNGGPLAYD